MYEFIGVPTQESNYPLLGSLLGIPHMAAHVAAAIEGREVWARSRPGSTGEGATAYSDERAAVSRPVERLLKGR